MKRDIHPWRDFHTDRSRFMCMRQLYENRHTSMKRNMYVWKETCIYETDMYLWKETNINIHETSARTIPALVDLGNCATSTTHSSTWTSQSPHLLHSLHIYYTVSILTTQSPNVLHNFHMYAQSPHLLHSLDVAWYSETCFLVLLKRPEIVPRWNYFCGSKNFQKKHTVYREGSFCSTLKVDGDCLLLKSTERNLRKKRKVDRGSSVIVKHSFVRKLSNI